MAFSILIVLALAIGTLSVNNSLNRHSEFKEILEKYTVVIVKCNPFVNLKTKIASMNFIRF